MDGDAAETRSDYNTVQENGQRKFGGPPPGWEGPAPPRGCEVFVGKIPRDMFEDELLPLFQRVGNVYEFRLMMEFSGENRGFAFVTYANRDAAERAIKELDNHEVRPGRFIGVCVSVDNCRLFISSVPKEKTRDDLMKELRKVTDDMVDVLLYPSSTDKSKNRGFAFVEYKSHKAAALARRKLAPGSFQLWDQPVQVDWAVPERDVGEDVMQRVKVLYVRNLMPSTTEATLQREFSTFKPGCVERVKKLGNYAFVHYSSRGDAVAALRLMNGAQVDGAQVEVLLAKPAANREGGGACGRKSAADRATQETGITAGGGGGKEAAAHRKCSATTGGAADGCSPLKTPPPPPSRTGNPAHSRAVSLDRSVFPLLPGTPLTPTSLLSLKQSQMSSAVGLLDFYCLKHFLSAPQYHLFSTCGPRGQLLLLYKVVIAATLRTYTPDKLCVLLEDAKEVAALTALWNLDLSLLNSSSTDSESGSSPVALTGFSPPGFSPLSPALTPPAGHHAAPQHFAGCLPSPY